MKTLWVELADRRYPIQIGDGLLNQLPHLLAQCGVGSRQKLFILTDSNIAPMYLEKVTTILLEAGYQVATTTVAAGEQAKRLAVYEQVTTAAIEAGLDRKSVVLALGGGVIGDLAGFVAATYMRGISFVQIPTTLLAHDSSVGGKVAINHPLGKNLLGAFHQPLMVVYDTATLTTLPKREIAAGFAEVIKHGLISDDMFVQWLEGHAERLCQLEPELLAEAIAKGCSIKAEVVAVDETEQGQRAILNLGHTFGHALEALQNYSTMNHGEAISIGMRLAADTAEQIGLAPRGIAERTTRLLRAFGLPTSWPSQLTPENVLEVMRRDKKTVGGQLVLVLPSEIGKVEIVRDVEESIVLQVMKRAQEEDRIGS